MSDRGIPEQPQLMSAVRARNLSRIYKGLADTLRQDGYLREAQLASNDAQWWITYALSLQQTPPGRVDDDWSGV